MKKLMPRNRLFYTILLYFLSLLIPIVVIGIVTYTNFVSTYKDDFAANARRNLEISAEQLDTHLRTVQEAGLSFFSEAAVNRLLKPDAEYDLAERASRDDILQSLKRTGAILTEFAEQLFMYIDHDKIYTTSGIEDFDSFFQRSATYDKLGNGFWKQALESDSVIEIVEPVTLTRGQSSQRVVPVLVGSMVRGHKALLVANISADDLQEKLRGYAPYPSTRFIVVDGYGRIVIGPLDQAEQPEQPEQPDEVRSALEEAFPSDASGSAELTVGETPYIASFVQSSLYGWKLYSLTPTGEFTRQAGGILDMIVIICASLAVIGLLFSFIFTFKLYTPIQRIRDVLSDNQDHDGLELPANEFGEIGQGISRLIRHNLTFEQQLHDIRFDYLDQTLLHLLKDRETVDTDQLQTFFREQLQFTSGLYRCCSIHFQFKDAFYEEIPEQDRMIVWSKLKKLIWGFLAKHFRLHVIECARHLYLCIIETDETGDLDEAGLREALESFLQTFQFDVQYCMVHVGIGRVHANIRGIAESYQEAMTALQYGSGNLHCEIIDYDRLETGDSVVYTFTDEIKVLNLLKTGEPNLKEKIRHYLDQQESRGMSAHMLSVLLTDVYRTGLRFVLEQGIERSSLIQEEEHRLLNESEELPSNPEGKRTLLLQFYDQLAAELSARQQSYKSHTLVAAITELIEKEYDRDLYLESISDRFGVSPKYVSRIFKEKTGLNITQYVSMIRVHQAKRLLTESDLSIGEIADKVGIHNRTTFLRIFKKTEGTTPQSFRNSQI